MARLEINLSARPFINERPLVNLAMALALGLAAATFVNVYTLFSALVESRGRKAELAVLRTETERALIEAERLQGSLSETEKRRMRKVAESATSIIRKRQLSWSRLFNQLEVVLPRDVRILQIAPAVESDRLVLLMECTARSDEAQHRFYNKLNEPPFRDAYILGETIAEGSNIFQVKCLYDPGGKDAEAVFDPAPWEKSRPRAGAVSAAGGGQMAAGLGSEPAEVR